MLEIRTKSRTVKTGPQKSANEKYKFRLFVAGLSPIALTAIKNLRAICDENFKGKYHIDVIDLLKYPKLGRKYQIIATPALARVNLIDSRIIIGDLSNREQVLLGLTTK